MDGKLRTMIPTYFEDPQAIVYYTLALSFQHHGDAPHGL